MLGDKLGLGHIRGLDLDFDADKVVFSYLKQPKGNGSEEWAHLYEMKIDGTGLRQVTISRNNMDIEPCYLPSGKFAFISDRPNYGSQCAGAFPQDNKYMQLYTCDANGENLRSVSNNKDIDRYPRVMENGSIIFTHWEYQERHLNQTHSLWTMRPDGGMMDALYMAHIPNGPHSLREARQVPGMEKVVCNVSGHHNFIFGGIALIDFEQGINNLDAMKLVTQPGWGPELGDGLAWTEGGYGAAKVVPEGGTQERGGQYGYPFPLSDKSFITTFSYKRPDKLYKTNFTQGRDFSLYYIDVWGNKELLERPRTTSIHWPIPIKKRQRPPVELEFPAKEGNFATVCVTNVYEDVPEFKSGEIKHIRVSQHMPWPCVRDDGKWSTYTDYKWCWAGSAWSDALGVWAWSPARTMGVVPVEEDGSAYFKVPAGQPVYFQALDEDFAEVRRMRSLVAFKPGEVRSCTGCHESKAGRAMAGLPSRPLALKREPSMPRPPSWGHTRLPNYTKDIQPIFDRNCVSCHGKEKPAGGLDFSGDIVDGYEQSYRTMFGLKRSQLTPIYNRVHDWLRDKKQRAERQKIQPDFGRTDENGIKLPLQEMRRNKYPRQLVKISDRFSGPQVTKIREFGSGVSKLTQTILKDREHAKAKAKMPRADWEDLCTWVDLNAQYFDTYGGHNHRNGQFPHRAKVKWEDPWVRPTSGEFVWSKDDPDLIELEVLPDDHPRLLWVGSDLTCLHDQAYQLGKWLRSDKRFEFMTGEAVHHRTRTLEDVLDPDYRADYGLRYGRPLLEKIKQDQPEFIFLEVPLVRYADDQQRMDRVIDTICQAATVWKGQVFLYEFAVRLGEKEKLDQELCRQAAERNGVTVIPGADAFAEALKTSGTGKMLWKHDQKLPGFSAAYLQIAMAYAVMGVEAPAEPRARYRAADYSPHSRLAEKYGEPRRMFTPWKNMKASEAAWYWNLAWRLVRTDAKAPYDIAAAPTAGRPAPARSARSVPPAPIGPRDLAGGYRLLAAQTVIRKIGQDGDLSLPAVDVPKDACLVIGVSVESAGGSQPVIGTVRFGEQNVPLLAKGEVRDNFVGQSLIFAAPVAGKQPVSLNIAGVKGDVCISALVIGPGKHGALQPMACTGTAADGGDPQGLALELAGVEEGALVIGNIATGTGLAFTAGDGAEVLVDAGARSMDQAMIARHAAKEGKQPLAVNWGGPGYRATMCAVRLVTKKAPVKPVKPVKPEQPAPEKKPIKPEQQAAEKKPVKAEQQELIDRIRPLAKQRHGLKVIANEDGDVIKFAISSSPAFNKGKPTGATDIGLDDALIGELVEKCPKLEAVALEYQRITGAGYAKLAGLKKLKDVRLHRTNHQEEVQGPAGLWPIFLNDLPPKLEVLEIKHNRFKETCAGKLKPQPELRYLELDTGFVGSDMVPFILAAKKLENLQLHRTDMTDEDLQKLYAGLPELKVLMIRPARNWRKDKKLWLSPRALRGIHQLKKLEFLILGLDWNSDHFPWEECLEAIAKLPKLKQLKFCHNPLMWKKLTLDHPAVLKLRKARPDIRIFIHGRGAIGGKEGEKLRQEDTEKNWDGGVTTHG